MLVAVSRLRRPFLSDRYFFVTVRLIQSRSHLTNDDLHELTVAVNRVRVMHPFWLTAWVFLPDHWHAILAPVRPLTISLAMKSIKTSSTILINRRRAESGELCQARFFDRALRTVKEYNETVGYIHWNPVKAGLAHRPQEWRWSSLNEYSGGSAADQMRRCGLTIDRVRLPADAGTRI